MTKTDNGYNVDLSIIVVSWNVRDLLCDCLTSINEKTLGITFEIIVVDNASSDGSVEMVRAEFPQVKLVASAENLGFGKANNLALQSATGRYIGLLNPDTVLLNNVFSMMISKLESEPEIGIAGPKLLASDGTVQEPCARKLVTLRSVIPRLLIGRMLATPLGTHLPPAEYDISQAVECISGACMVIRREILTDERIFDPQFFMYAEDIDLCYETVHRGWEIFYLSEALVTHYGGKSASQDPISTVLYMIRAVYRFFVKRHGKLTGHIYRCLCVVVPAVKLVVTWLIQLSPRFRRDPVWVQRGLEYPQMIRCAMSIED
jgi:GT2 family glycosyltransferase